MTLYHFCADKHVRNIMRKGLTIGAVPEPTATSYIVHNGWIWLTTDSDPAHQSWAKRFLLKYSRTAWRLTIEIPDDHLHRIHDREKLCKIYPRADMLFAGWPGSECWRVFRGDIHKSWIVKAERM